MRQTKSGMEFGLQFFPGADYFCHALTLVEESEFQGSRPQGTTPARRCPWAGSSTGTCRSLSREFDIGIVQQTF